MQAKLRASEEQAVMDAEADYAEIAEAVDRLKKLSGVGLVLAESES